jgi:plastocyanin
MNTRRLSFGLLVTFAAAMLAACGDSTPEPQTPAASATPADTDAAAPSAATEPAPPPAPTAEPAPPPKPAKDKVVGTFTQDFSGDVMDAAVADAAKKAGKADKDGKKAAALVEKAKKAFSDAANTIVVTADTLTWNAKGKPAHAIAYTVSSKADDPTNLTIKLGKDATTKKDLQGQELSISFSDDSTFSFKDPFAKKDPKTLVWKK